MQQRNEFVAIDCESLPWKRPNLPDGEPKGITYRSIFQGGEGLPQVSFNRYEPHWMEARHRHLEDEVLMLVEGEINVGGNVYCAPTVVFVGRGTLYGPLTAGPNGVAFYRVAYTEDMIKRKTPEEAASAASS